MLNGNIYKNHNLCVLIVFACIDQLSTQSASGVNILPDDVIKIEFNIFLLRLL